MSTSLEGEETQETRNILSWMRKGWPLLAEDLTLLFLLDGIRSFRGEDEDLHGED